MTIRHVSTARAPRPAGHYSQAVIHNGVVHVAGQLPLDPETGEVEEGDSEAQTDRVLANIAAILEAAGSSLDRVLMLNVFVNTRDDWAGVNAACVRHFGEHRPARAIVGGAELKPGCRVEITATAAL